MSAAARSRPLAAVDRAQDSVLSLYRVRPLAVVWRVRGATRVRFGRTCWTRLCGPRFCGCSRRGVDPAGTGSSVAAAQAADPTSTRTQAPKRDLAPVGKTIERLLTACQEDSVSLDQLRERMPLLRQREQAPQHELNALVELTRDRAAHLHLAEALSRFVTRLRASAETLDIVERRQIVWLHVRVNDNTIVIRHCIPIPSGQRVLDRTATPTASPTVQVPDRSVGTGTCRRAGRAARRGHRCRKRVDPCTAIIASHFDEYREAAVRRGSDAPVLA